MFSNYFMKKIVIFIFFMLFFMLASGCVVKKMSNVQESPRTEIKNIKNHTWSELIEVQNMLKTKKGKIIVLFSLENDSKNKKIFNLAKENVFFDEMLKLNLNEPWVQETFMKMQLTDMPSIVILDSDDKKEAVKVMGYNAVMVYIKHINDIKEEKEKNEYTGP